MNVPNSSEAAKNMTTTETTLYHKHDGSFGRANNFEHKEDECLNNQQKFKMF